MKPHIASKLSFSLLSAVFGTARKSVAPSEGIEGGDPQRAAGSLGSMSPPPRRGSHRGALGVAAALVAVGLVAAACGVAPEDEVPEDALSEADDSYSDLAICNTCEPPDDPPPVCTPSCTGKSCGASNGCGGKCGSGSCPAGTTCGGGGVAYQCGCTAQCSGKACGAPDGCGGICTGGACPYGQGCGAAGVPGQCATLPIGQGVECFVFNDGYTNMAGPTQALSFRDEEGLVCMPDGTPGGTCRKWFGRCQTTDPSHTPVLFSVFNDGRADMSGPSDAVYVPSHHQACVPDGTPGGFCRKWFGAAKLPDGRPVECKLFEDGGAQKTKYTDDDMFVNGLPKVTFPNGAYRKWFGECMVTGCGDGACNNGETPSSCPSDCKCGDGVCNGNEWCGSCSADCGSCCGNHACDNGETCSSCSQDCGSCCGNGACDNNESCESCSKDCGACPPKTCSGQYAGPQAQNVTVGVEEVYFIAGVGYVVGCLAATPTYFANSEDEAALCGQNAFPGYNIITSGPIDDYVYHNDPTNGCVSYSFYATSSTKAAWCGYAHGYPYEGGCN
ncbi:hypothetical protein [Polyangium sp. 6x1]|uniref:hypothetical protein n=1 Tax=Polyangium sp. 6x1 TaxID=3042689 RepID=UPI002482153C|nr:hypothetical protein [Polyangium sp. 6x1]MDI1442523.1 hypothetical protein [Polyangium sp. 6x1]